MLKQENPSSFQILASKPEIMKTLNDHVILYDNECPMCDLYTNAFVKTGMLDKGGRVAFTEATDIISKHKVSRIRACDEIALVNLRTGAVEYGVNSLMQILGNRFPWLTTLFANRIFVTLASKLYSFVSLNRKVIIPGKDIENINACRPTFNLAYRILYLAFTWLLTSFILAKYATVLQPLIPPTNFYREFLICGGQIVFQGLIIYFLNRKKMWEYLGNMMTISFAGGLLLSIALAFTGVLQSFAFAGIFAFVVALMFLEHLRRVRLLRLPWIMTVTWVIYRVMILSVLF
jgi:predicted DCC family thiol-disulfide oxidoreductase YuxK